MENKPAISPVFARVPREQTKGGVNELLKAMLPVNTIPVVRPRGKSA